MKASILLPVGTALAIAGYAVSKETPAEQALKVSKPLPQVDLSSAIEPVPATAPESAEAAPGDAGEPTPVPDPVDTTETVEKGLEWLASQQHADGGWGQGGGWRTNTSGQGGRVEGPEVNDPADIGNTAIALKSFLRAGTKLGEGKYSENARKAADFLFAAVEKSDEDTLFVTDVRGTQLQSKIGPYVDTFLAMQVLADLNEQMPDEKAEDRRARCLAKLAAKIEKNQKDDGSFDGNTAWAATVSQGIASKAINGAWAAGAPVAEETLARDHAQNATGLDPQSGEVAAGAGGVSDAGVAIYRYASKLGGMADYAKNNDKRRKEFQQKLDSEDASEEIKKQAKDELAKIDKADKEKEVLLSNVSKQAGQAQFVAGFGNNGGEEFVSFMNIAEAMHAKGGKPWNEWQARMDTMLRSAQHNDGSWSGQHCITGRTFCTSTALLTLTTDRMTVEEPVAAKTE